MLIRDATDHDAEGIAIIYNDAVANTTAIWNDAIVDIENRRDWIAERQAAGFPVLVAVEPGVSGTGTGTGTDDVLGYATYGPFRPHDGFRRTVEHSVYVRNDQRGAGLGGQLMAAIIDRARSTGIHVMVAGIDASNTGSIRLHERLGFQPTGVLTQVGTKFGRWLDLAFLQLTFDAVTPPE